MMDFEAELRTLLQAPYSYIHLITHDEARAVSMVARHAREVERGVREWSATRGMEPSGDGEAVPPGDFHALLDAVEAESQPVIFILKDPHPFFGDPAVVRRLREMESLVAAFGKSVVMCSPVPIDLPELATDLTQLTVPLPGREALDGVCQVVFPPDRWPSIDRHALVGSALGLTSRQALRAFHRARIECLNAFRQGDDAFDLESAVRDEKRRVISRDDVVEFVPADFDMQDVGGMDELKGWLSSRRDAFGAQAREFGLPTPKGLLLLGVQGCGKSLMAKVVAAFWGLPLIRMDMAAVFSGDHSPERALRQALRTAEAISPVVLWLDELEKAFNPEEGGDGEHRLLGSLLTWLQEKTRPVFFVATANQVDQLPPELLRKGRFDEIFFVDLPDKRSRQQILGIHLRRQGRNPSFFDCAELAELTLNFSGAELEQIIISALYLAFGEKAELSQQHLTQAARETVPLFRTREEEIKSLRAWARERARPASRDATLFDLFQTERPKPRR